MSTAPGIRDWQEAAWAVASKLLIAAMATVAIAAGALAMVRGNAVPATVLVAVGQQNGDSTKADQYNPASVGISAGDTIRWEWFGGTHDVTSYAETSPGTPEWQSGLIKATGHFFERQFMQPGTFTYYCSIHALPEEGAPAVIDQNIAGGKMVGKVVVAAPVTPTPSPSPAPSPSTSPTVAPTSSPTPTPAGASATPTPAATASPAPSDTPAPTAAPTETPGPAETSTPTPAPTQDPQPTSTPVPTAPPPESPTPAPTDGQTTATPEPTPSPAVTAPPRPTGTGTPAPVVASVTPAPTSPAATLAPAGSQATPTPKSAANAQPVALGQAGAPQGFPQTGSTLSDSGGEGISPIFRVITLSLTGLLIAIVVSGFIWIERSQRDQPR